MELRNEELPVADNNPGQEGNSNNELPKEINSTNSQVIREGQPAGGQNFGKNNNTSAANDKNNPSQYAGNSNAYFDRTEPSEEHPEDSNFKVPKQAGAPDYDKAQAYSATNTAEPKPEKVERGDGENDRPHKGENDYQEGTADNDNVNIPGPNELPDQQKVGEDVPDDGRAHIET
jgi:hypothetical protein